MDAMMKNNSVKTAPKGKTPPAKEVNMGCMNQGCSGTSLLIWQTRTGNSMAGLRKPACAPRSTRGTETIANIVVNGTAPDDFCLQMNRLRMKNTMKNNPG